MARIRIITGRHLCTAPRVQKEARALADAGHEVVVQGVWVDSRLADRDTSILRKAPYRFVPVADLRGFALLQRARRRLGVAAWRHFRHFRPAVLGYGVAAQLRAARQAQADLTIAHCEAGLWIACRLAAAGRRVGVDFEDWFSEDLLPADRVGRPVERIRDFEHELLRVARYRLAPSAALARALGEAAGVTPPTCVYNVFPLADRQRPRLPVSDRKTLVLPSLHWFSQTLGPGRGLEQLFAALPHVRQPCEIHLRGNCSAGVRAWCDGQIPADWRERVVFHPEVHPSELLSRLYGHDIGLALETPAIRSRDLTVTNKIFHYLLAELAVIATATAGQSEVAERAGGAVKLVPPGDGPALAAAIDAWLAFPQNLKAARKAAVEAVRDPFCWERQRELLLDEAALALGGA